MAMPVQCPKMSHLLLPSVLKPDIIIMLTTTCRAVAKRRRVVPSRAQSCLN